MHTRQTIFILLTLSTFSLSGCVSKVITTPVGIVVDTATDVVGIVTP